MLGALLPLYLLVTFVAAPARIDGDSMNPTLHSGDLALLLKYPRWLHAWGLPTRYPVRGDIVIFKAPSESEYAWESGPLGLRHRPYNIKRVLGLPGDVLEVRGGRVWRNGQALTESYASGETFPNEERVAVPPGSIYVLGDNRIQGDSVDSRYYGAVSLRDVAGPANWHLRLPWNAE